MRPVTKLSLIYWGVTAVIALALIYGLGLNPLAALLIGVACGRLGGAIYDWRWPRRLR